MGQSRGCRHDARQPVCISAQLYFALTQEMHEIAEKSLHFALSLIFLGVEPHFAALFPFLALKVVKP
jgi:hypothetical protein